MQIESNYKALVESIRLLACSYEEQKRCLPKFTVVKDEVVALFGDAFLLMPQLIEGDLLSNKSIASIIRCYNIIEIASRNNDISDEESFTEHKIWQKVRYLASIALEEMKEEKGKPNLDHIDWID